MCVWERREAEIGLDETSLLDDEVGGENSVRPPKHV